MVVVTKQHLEAARKAGACSELLRYKPGTPLHEVASSHLDWFESQFPDVAKAASVAAAKACRIKSRAVLPLAIFGYGYGYGDGYGYGYGDGYGYGYGAGAGYGYGYGDGSGDGRSAI